MPRTLKGRNPFEYFAMNSAGHALLPIVKTYDPPYHGGMDTYAWSS